MSVDSVINVGIKGSDLVVNTFDKLEKKKKQFEKESSTSVKARGGRSSQSGDRGKSGSDIERESDSERRSKQKEVNNSEKMAKSTKLAAGALENAAKGFSSLNPVEFIRSAASSTVQLTAGLAGGAANAAWGGSGEIVRAIIEHAGRLVDMGVQAASGALNAYKSALPVVLQRNAQKSMIDMAGAQGINNQSMTRAESAQMAAALLPTVGKIGKEFNSQLKKLYDVRKGSIVNRQQANALAQGDFSALGTNKGWLLNQISQSTGGMPPEMAQKFRSGLLAQVSRKELGKEKAGTRIAAQAMETSDLRAQDRIVSAGNRNWKSLKSANNNLNQLQVNMINSVSSLNKVLGEAAGKVSSVLTNLQTDINKARAKAGEESKRAAHK